jgi:hypothetical protein
MTRILYAVVAMTLAGALVAPGTGLAQGGPKWRGSGGWGPGGNYTRMFDANTVETVSGEVAKVEYATPMRGMSAGVHLLLKTAKGEVSVHLGPAWYLENQDVKLEPRDLVEVTGSRVTIGGKPTVIAASVTKGAEVLKLRDESGRPVWAGWRRG